VVIICEKLMNDELRIATELCISMSPAVKITLKIGRVIYSSSLK